MQWQATEADVRPRARRVRSRFRGGGAVGYFLLASGFTAHVLRPKGR